MFIRIVVLLMYLLSMLSFHAPAKSNKEWVYVVVEGDNLWDLSEKYLKKVSYYKQLQQLNEIKRPKRLKPGSLIRVPMDWLSIVPATATISSYLGKSKLIRDGNSLDVKLGTALKLGDALKVGDKASVTVTFADGSETTIFSLSTLFFDYLSAFGQTGMVDTRIRLGQGKLETRAAKAKGAGSRLDISTVSAISSVRGTIFRVASDAASDRATVEVVEGTVAVTGNDVSQAVHAGFATQVLPEKAPSKPVELLSAPVFINPLRVIENDTDKLSWQPVNGAIKYQIQLSDNQRFSRILWESQTQNPSVTLPVKQDNHYFVRVSAIDSNDIEGWSSSHQYTLNLQPYAPQVQPYSTTENRISWQANQGASRFQLQISVDSSFDKMMVNTQTSNTSYSIESLNYGEYYWRVAQLDEQGRGPFSTVSNFSYKPVLSVPQWQYEYTDKQALISWLSARQDQVVIIEIAADKYFTQQVKQYRSTEKQLAVPLFENGETYVRLRRETIDGNAIGQWSKAEELNYLNERILAVFAGLLWIVFL